MARARGAGARQDAPQGSQEGRRGPRSLPAAFQDAITQAAAEDTRPCIDPLTVTLPFPPSANNAYFNVVTRTGMSKRVKTERASEFAKTVKEHVEIELMAVNCRPPQPPYRLTLHLYPPMDGRKHDASNVVKIPEDALMKAVGGDDDDVLEVHVFKHAKDRQPRLEMTLEHTRPRGEE